MSLPDPQAWGRRLVGKSYVGYRNPNPSKAVRTLRLYIPGYVDSRENTIIVHVLTTYLYSLTL